MKKIFPILLLSMILGLFSSCIIVPPEALEEPKYTMYFYNDTTVQHVYDWYLKDEDDNNYVASENKYCEVPVGTYAGLSGLRKNYYQIWFCVYSNRSNDFYVHSDGLFYLDSNATFYLSDLSIVRGGPRSAVTENEQVEQLVIVDSKGNIYPTKTEIINKQK